MAALVVANWKMNGSAAFVDAFAASWQEPPHTVDAVVCPPLAYLQRLAQAMAGHRVRFGVQDVAAQPAGPFTGEHSAPMARDLGAEFAIVGHSERRALFAETNTVVASKFAAAKDAGLVPILCVGETLAERRAERAQQVVLDQFDAVIDRCGAAAMADAVLAYEPVWAIGSGETASPAQAQEMHEVLRRRMTEVLGGSASSVRILYGGSVKAANAGALFAQQDVDGALVGGASLDAAEFAAICCAVAPEAPLDHA